jgi:hypothetical protein
VFLSGLTGGIAYEFQVQSICGSTLSAFSNSSSFNTLVAACATPGGLTISNITNTTANLSWNSTGAGSYYVRYKAISNVVWSNIITSQLNISVGGLQTGTSYEWQVQSVCATTSSSYSESSVFTTTAPFCTTPAGLMASNITQTTGNLSWSATGASSYYVRYKPVTSFVWVFLALLQVPPMSFRYKVIVVLHLQITVYQ